MSQPPGPADQRSVDPALRRRARRVTVLLLGIVVLSVGDLLVTLGHLQSSGMAEANPIAAWIIRHTGSAAALVLYKVLTVGVCVTLLYWFRRRPAGEVAAWVGVAMLLGMCVMWHAYSRSIASPAALDLVQASHGEDWLVLD